MQNDAEQSSLHGLTKNTTDLFSGTYSGLSTILAGSCAGVGLLVGAPISGLCVGAQSAGISGAVGGLIAGSMVGAISGTAVITTSAITGANQMVYGVLRTPRAIVAVCQGEDWDENTEEVN